MVHLRAPLVKSHSSIDVLVGPFLLTVFGERQPVAENLHAAEMSFKRCPIMSKSEYHSIVRRDPNKKFSLQMTVFQRPDRR